MELIHRLMGHSRIEHERISAEVSDEDNIREKNREQKRECIVH